MLRDLKIRIASRLWRFLKYWGEETRLHAMSGIIAHHRAQGVRIGENVQIFHTRFDPIYPQLITIGSDVTITNAVILTHDDSAVQWEKKRRVAPVAIGSRVFVGWGSIILPGVTIGDDCVIGAGAVVTRDVPAGSVVAGNPAKAVRSIEEFRSAAASNRHVIDFALAGIRMTDDEERAVRKIVEQKYSIGVS